MRKKIAVFANGWGSEYLQQTGEGICKCAKDADVDVFAFVNYSTHIENTPDNLGEFNIFTLPDMKDFDGAIILANSFNLQKEQDYVQKKLKESKIPAVSLLCPLEGAVYVRLNNYDGIRKLTNHLIEEHGVRDIVFIGGYQEHDECRERLRAVLDTAREHHLTIPEQNILFGDWSGKSAEKCLDKWFEQQTTLPDVFICANDIMAIAVCDYLEARGIKVPRDVKVTGYDGIQTGQEHWPILTTVSQNWREMGENAMQLLLDRMAGKETPSFVNAETKFVYGESCGCGMDNREESMRKGKLSDKFNGFATDQHFRHMYMAVRKAKSLDDLHRCFTMYFEDERWMEGNNIMLCMTPDFFETENSDSEMKKIGYPKKMDMVCSIWDGKSEEHQRITLQESVFSKARKAKQADTYMFVPLHSEDMTYGYAMMNCNFEIIGDNVLYIWTRHLRQYLEQVRSNIYIEELTGRLEALSVTDGLTQAYNRMGYDTIMVPKAQYCQSQGGQLIVLIADLDRLKVINDTYGHTKGDIALRLVAQSMKKALPELFQLARFGGDEFLAIGEYDGKLGVEELEALIEKQVALDKAEQNITFPVSVSVGGVLLEKGIPFDITECLPKADSRMYQIKEEHHSRMQSEM